MLLAAGLHYDTGMATSFCCWLAAMTGFETQRPAIAGYEKVNDLCPSPLDDENSLEYGSVKVASREFQKIPVETPFTWSAWTFMWFKPIITLGQTKLIDKNDMLDLPQCLTSKEVLATFMQCWTFESLNLALKTSGLSPTTDGRRKPKLWRVLHTMIRREFWIAGTCRFFNDALLVSTLN